MYSSNDQTTSSPSDELEQDDTVVQNKNQQGEKCFLPKLMDMPKSPDGTYSPPAPHQSLVRAVAFASNEEYQDYCKKYDPILGAYTDEWKYNENGECGNWQEKYTQLHHKDRAILEKYQQGDFPDIDVAERPKFISYICKMVPKDSNRGCGGLADRMGGK